jgi:23S rRNA G2445 N2-methylase RlmL
MTHNDIQHYDIFIGITPNLERFLLQELVLLGVSSASTEIKCYDTEGGVEMCHVTPETLWRVVLFARSADNVRVRLGEPFYALNWRQLQRRLRSLPFASFYPLTSTTGTGTGTSASSVSSISDRRMDALPTVRVSTHSSRLYHSGAVAERVRAYLASQFPANTTSSISSSSHGITFSSQLSPSELFVRVDKNLVQVSVEAARHMWKRFLHASNGKWMSEAPLRESIACALLLCAQWPQLISTVQWFNTSSNNNKSNNRNPSTSSLCDRLTVWDPFCGSGTLLLEAFMMSVMLLLKQPTSSSPPSSTTLITNTTTSSHSLSDCHRYHTLIPTSPARIGFYPFERWPCHDSTAFASFVRANDHSLTLWSLLRDARLPLQFVGSDIDSDAIRAALHNRDLLYSTLTSNLSSSTNTTNTNTHEDITKMNLSRILHFERGDFEEVLKRLISSSALKGPIVIITNLPYGVRSGSENIRTLYQRWQHFLHRHRTLWHSAYFLTPHSRSHVFASSTSSLLSFRNRGDYSLSLSLSQISFLSFACCWFC